MNDVFLDTSYAVALSVESDSHHPRAVELAERILKANSRMITTQAVILEIGNALSRPRHRAACVGLLDLLLHDPMVEIVNITAGLLADALLLFRQRMDKAWGLVDCMSFTVLKQRHLVDVLTSDMHFKQAGFHCLLTDGDD
jgi:uncharacterized protein